MTTPDTPCPAKALTRWISPVFSSRTRLLIIDDFGLTPLNADYRLSLLELLDDRYNKVGTIVTGQVPVDAWQEIIGEPTIADAVMDRLAHTPWIFELQGGSRRRKTP